ncbi:hypothetical protein J5690_03095, partial [bacterium]|nr:hypothetical protein [bacterium]
AAFKKEASADEYDKRLLRVCSKAKREELMKVTSELLTEEEAKQLLEIANHDDMKFWFADKSLSNKEKFLGGFYHKVLPTVMSVFNPRFDAVRLDFLRYFILWDNFAEERRYETADESFKTDVSDYFFVPKETFDLFKSGDTLKKLKTISDIPALYKFAADEISGVRLEKRFEREFCPSENEYLRDSISISDYNNTARCFYGICKGLLNNTGFLTAAVNQNLLSVKFVFDTLKYKEYVEKSHEILATASKLFMTAKTDEEVLSLRKEHEGKGIYVVKVENDEEDPLKKIMFEHDSYDEILEWETKKKLAEIFFENEEMKNYLAEKVPGFGIGIDEFRNSGFFSFMMKLDPEYREPIKRRVYKMNLKNLEELKDAGDLFVNFGEILLGQLRRCCNGEPLESQEEALEYLKDFLEERVLGKWYFTELPEVFQKIVLALHTLDFCGKSADFSEVGIDKNALKKEIDTFLGELKKIAASGGKPSDYYEYKPVESCNIPNVESYISTQAFHAAVVFLRDCFGTWKAAKPMLAIFRSLKEQAYSIDMEHYEYDRYTWAFVPVRITPLLGSLESEEAAKVCEEWFRHLADQLKSADDYAINKRKENPEDVPEEFKEGYDITVIEPHPLWREAFCEAAGDLRVNSGCKSVFNHLKKNDIDKDVREAAAKTLERIEKIKGKFDSGSRKRALLNAWWWYRVAHLKSLGIDFDWVSAQNLKSKEVKINYPKI